MIKHIVAIDNQRGFAKKDAAGKFVIPWKLPGDTAYYKAKIKGQRLLMGRNTYSPSLALSAAYVYVLTHDRTLAVENGEPVQSVEEAIRKNGDADLWVIGGLSVYEPTMALADELYITRVEGDFSCERFYPTIPQEFARTDVSKDHEENGVTYRFEIYKKQD